jgi:hypothetical protein
LAAGAGGLVGVVAPPIGLSSPLEQPTSANAAATANPTFIRMPTAASLMLLPTMTTSDPVNRRL